MRKTYLKINNLVSLAIISSILCSPINAAVLGGQFPVDIYVPPITTGLTGSMGPTSETNTSANSNMGYGGVKWTLGGSLVPEIVAGYSYASITNNGATQGGDISMSFKITGKTELNNLIHLGKLRAKYLNGTDYLQGEVGGGWDFANKGLFAGVSAQGSFVNTGLDYDFSGKNAFGKSFSPYLEFNSLGIYSRPHKFITNPVATPLAISTSPNPLLNTGLNPNPLLN
jgi:hypothetical protein